MKPGCTTLQPAADPRFPPTVYVGDDDRAVRVDFGAVRIFLSNQANGSVIVVRAEPTDERVRIETRGAADVRHQIEYVVEVIA